MNITVTDAVILEKQNGPDVILFTTTLPSGIYPYTGFADVELRLASGSGEEYLLKNFPKLLYNIVKVG